jgi:hypothetical protein
MRVETEFKERSTQLSFRARRRPRPGAKRHVGNEVAPTFRIGGRGIPHKVLVLTRGCAYVPDHVSEGHSGESSFVTNAA